MKLNQYQQLAKRTIAPKHDLRCMAMGLAEEAGEVLGVVKKGVYHGHPIPLEKLKEELGDALWYLAGMATDLGLSLEDIAAANIEKIKRRYPNGYSDDASRGRVDEKLPAYLRRADQAEDKGRVR